jgi:hypothetical protein
MPATAMQRWRYLPRLFFMPSAPRSAAVPLSPRPNWMNNPLPLFYGEPQDMFAKGKSACCHQNPLWQQTANSPARRNTERIRWFPCRDGSTPFSECDAAVRKKSGSSRIFAAFETSLFIDHNTPSTIYSSSFRSIRDPRYQAGGCIEGSCHFSKQ